MQIAPINPHAFAARWRALACAVLVMLGSLACAAAGNDRGTISGRITDSGTKLALGGARITVAGTELVAFAGPAGEYTLNGVPAGRRTIVVSYVGYEDVTRAVMVEPRRTTVVDVAFGSDLVILDRFVLTGSAVGSARAINRQRAADTLTNHIASDEIGRFADQNAAETLQRVPGVSIYRDQGEGRFVVVRGLRPDYNSVKLDGVALASPERGDRVVALDVLPTDALAGVEVTKVPTPDQDADGLGGSINVRTRSAFDAEGRVVQASAQGQYGSLSGDLGSKFNATYSDHFKGGTIGFIISPTWQERTFGSNNFEEDGGYTLRPVPGGAAGAQAYFLNGIAFRQYEITRTRYGTTSALEFKPDRQTHYYVRGTFSQFNDHENRYAYTVPFSEGTLVALSGTEGSVTAMRRERYESRRRVKEQRVLALSAGGEKTVGDWKFDGHIAWSRGEEERPAETTVRFRKSSRGSAATYSFAEGTYAPGFAITGVNLSDPVLYDEISRFRVVDSPGTETETNLGFNAKRAFKLGHVPADLKFGVQRREKIKRASTEIVDYAVPASFTFASVSERQPDYPFFSPGLRASVPKILAAFHENPGAFTPKRQITESTLGDWETTEDVTAGYAMFAATHGSVKILTGLRVERTDFENRGNQLTGTVAVPASRGHSYVDVLPGFHLRYELPRQTILRASWNNSLVRPTFADSALRRNVSQTTGRVTEGNPELMPLESTNWDASIERYLPSLGLLSVAVFRKDIENFTYQRDVPGGDPATGYTLTTFSNGAHGRISGLEFAWQQQLRALPAPFDGVGVMANYTLSSSQATYPTRPGERIDFIGQSREIGNLALTYERDGFFIRVALNFRSPRLREDEPLGANAATDRWVDDSKQIDVTLSYRLNPEWELYAEGSNLTNEPFRVYFGKNGTRLVQFEEYGASASFGLRWRR